MSSSAALHPLGVRRARVYTVVLSVAAIAPLCVQAEISTGIDAEANLPYWEFTAPGISLRLVQRLPDQTRAFFMARGFSREAVEQVAQSCVFQTVFKNTSNTTDPDPLEYDLRDWVIQSGGVRQGMQTREDWAVVWTEQDAPKPARIAFEWALFPTRQVYNPGDYNWGMSIFDLVPGSRFDLSITWKQYGTLHTAHIEDMQCAPDSTESVSTP